MCSIEVSPACLYWHLPFYFMSCSAKPCEKTYGAYDTSFIHLYMGNIEVSPACMYRHLPFYFMSCSTKPCEKTQGLQYRLHSFVHAQYMCVTSLLVLTLTFRGRFWKWNLHAQFSVSPQNGLKNTNFYMHSQFFTCTEPKLHAFVHVKPL